MDTLITYGYDEYGNIYLDCHLHIPTTASMKAAKLVEQLTGHNPYKSILSALHLIALRSHFQNTRTLILPGEWTRDEAEILIKTTPRERLNDYSFKLQASL